MIKKLFILLMTFSCVILFNLLVSGKPDDSISSKAFVEDFLCAKMNILVSNNIDDIDKYYSKQSENPQKYMLFTKQNLLQDYMLAYSSNDYVIEKVIPHVKIISSSVDGKTATIEAKLKAHIYWNASNALGEPIVGTKYEQHKLILSKEHNKWKILVDDYMTERGPSDESTKEDFTRLAHNIEKLKKEVADSLTRSKRSKPTRLTMAFSEQQLRKNNEEVNQSQSKAKLTYDRDAAYNWAHTYWNTYSTAFANFGDQTGEGGDCTNFISQCLRAGGANNDKTGSYQWYYSTAADYSWTWSIARGLNYILLGNNTSKEFGPKGTERVINSNDDYDSTLGQYVTLGDVIQYEWSETSKIKHSAIIVNMVYNSSKERYEPVIATHSVDAWYMPWTKNAYKTHFVHITGIK